jgi:hypothetical protein
MQKCGMDFYNMTLQATQEDVFEDRIESGNSVSDIENIPPNITNFHSGSFKWGRTHLYLSFILFIK